MPPPLIVLDTGVVVSAVLGREDASSSAVIRAVETGGVRVATSDAYFVECQRTMKKPRVERRGRVSRAFDAALATAFHGEHSHPRRHEWPTIPDREDWWVLDLALESGADYIVTWDTGHLDPARSLGFDVLTPPVLLARLRR